MREERFPALASLMWTALPNLVPVERLTGQKTGFGSPKPEDIQTKPSPGAPGTQTSALLLPNETHTLTDPHGQALTGSMLAGTRDHRESLNTAKGGFEHTLCRIPRLYPSTKLAPCGASSSPRQLALNH